MQEKRKKVRDIIRQIQKEQPEVLRNDNALCTAVWLHEGFDNRDSIILHGSSAGTILRARNHILQKE